MKEIELTKGFVAVVDDCDFDALSQWKWHAMVDRSGHVYAGRNTKPSGRVLMHRAIMAAMPDQVVDHKDRNPLNNRRANLRLCSRGQNRSNSVPSSACALKGVTWIKRDKRWIAQITYNKIKRTIGYFDNPIDAAKAYDKIAVQLHGQFALTNQSLYLL